MLFRSTSCVNVVYLQGIISPNGRQSLSLKSIKDYIDKAFNGKKVKAVALLINSPGGSPVQSEMIANYISDKAKKHKIEVISFVEDVAASGGYWLALTGKSVYALSSSSIVGSIGVISASFGLDEFIKHHNISRRVYTAGEHKVNLDPFQTEKPEDVDFLKQLLTQIHQHFKNWVLQKRKHLITLKDEELFSGRFWLASLATKYGLVDGVVSSLEAKLKELYGEKVKINYITPKKSLINKLMGSQVNLVNAFWQEGIEVVKQQTQWNKFNL